MSTVDVTHIQTMIINELEHHRSILEEKEKLAVEDHVKSHLAGQIYGLTCAIHIVESGTPD
ncbi:hypothetical protein [Saccharibacillus qingshengii]|uniref:hypothetical protein n=1 Tax=Saccharibacillus qingshengii TaxID=1763540 RepID=UPI001553457F|nr:hypothetical protein [Saccharibacillus qingshengii]